LCFRLHFTKDSQAVINTAGATVRQLVSLVFERALHEDEQFEQLKDHSGINNGDNKHDLSQQSNVVDTSTPVHVHQQHQIIKTPPINNQHNYASNSDINSVVASLRPCAADAYLMFQVLFA